MKYLMSIYLFADLLSDKSLIENVQKGDTDSFEKIVKRYEKKVYATALRMIKDPDEAYDVTQEVFIKVFKYIQNFRGDAQFSTWLFRIVSNACIDMIRKNAKEKGKTFSIDEPIQIQEKESYLLELESKESTPEQTLEKKTKLQIIKDAIYHLPEDQRIAVILRDIQGFSYQEIAEMTDSNLGTVKSRISRGRFYLKQYLKDNEELFSS